MSSIFTAFMYKLLVMFISFTSMFGVVAAPSTETPIVPDENANMTVVLWGDPQVADYMADRHQYTKNAALDLANAQGTFDALVVAGDIAENGKGAEYQLVLDYLAVAENIDNHIMAVGNHDVRLRAYSQVVGTFKEFSNAANEKFADNAKFYADGKLSYTYDVNGYTFIVLNTDKSVFEESSFTDECLAWFDAELNKATADGKPVFVILHQPLKATHNVVNAWNSSNDKAGTVGKQSDALQATMNKYNNVFLITGHLHMGFSHEYSIHEIDNFWGINLPGIGPKNADGDYYNESGTGYIMEVYDNEVKFIARDFNVGKNIPEYDRTIALVK